ncbi:MAG TPA: hypothetical protein V6C65_07270, partial [Allocoleopsis sp.]
MTPGWEVRVFYGKGQKRGAAKNTNRDATSFSQFVSALPFSSGKRGYRVIQPTMLYHLYRFDPDIIICESGSYFPNNLLAFMLARFCKKGFMLWEPG